MTQSQPPLLAYAASDVHAERFSRPFMVWSIAMGVMVLAGLVLDTIGRGSIVSLLNIRNFRGSTFGEAMSQLVWGLNSFLPCVAAVAIVIGVLMTWRSGWAVSTFALRLIRIGAVILSINAVLQVAYAPYWMLEMHRQIGESYPLSQNIASTVSSMISSIVPAVLVTAASMRRFHARPDIARRLAGALAIATAVPVVVIMTDQAIRWALGTPPGWLNESNTKSSFIPAWQQKLRDLFWIINPLMTFAVSIVMLVAGLLALAARRWQEAALRTIAVTVVVASVGTLVLFGLVWTRNWGSLSSMGGMLISHAFQLTLAAGALMGAVRHPEPLSGA